MNSDPTRRWCPRAIYRHPGLNPACSRRGAIARPGQDVLGRAPARRSRLCGPDAGRARIELDRPSGLELFAVEAEYHEQGITRVSPYFSGLLSLLATILLPNAASMI